MVIAILLELAFVGFLLWSWFGARPSVPRFTAAHGLAVADTDVPLVRATLRRTYRGRVIGALVGAVLLGGTALTIGVGAAVVGTFVGLVSGSMVGIALAQHRRRPDPALVRQASLDARTVAEYTTPHGPWWIGAACLACVVVPAVVFATAPAGLGPYAPLLIVTLACVLIVPIGVVLQRRVVEAPRDDLDPRVDDVLRSTAVRALHHAVLGVLLCGVAVGTFAGSLTHSGATVVDDHGTVFRAPPGTTSTSIDTGLLQAGRPNAPIRVLWIEADGSEHHTRWFHVVGAPRYGEDDSPSLIQLYGWIMLGTAIAALVQWWRAVTSWRRPAADRRHDAPTGPAGVPA